MRLLTLSLFVSAILCASITVVPTPADAQVPIGGYMTKKDLKGNPKKVRATGKYADCVRDGQKLGNSREAAIRYCDGRKAAGWVK